MSSPPLDVPRRRAHPPPHAPGPNSSPDSSSDYSEPAATRLVKFDAPEIVFGAGSLSEAGYAAARLGARRPLVVKDPGLIEAGWVDELLLLLTTNPREASAADIVALFRAAL